MSDTPLPFKLSKEGEKQLEKSLEENAKVVDLEPSEYSIMEREDEKQIMSAMQGELIKQYVYQFTHKGRQVTGLSWAGVKEASRRFAEFTTELVEKEEDEETISMIIRATRIIRSQEDPGKIIGEDSRLGACRQKKYYKSGEAVDFAYVQCLNKAQRNALRALLPEEIIAKTIEHYLENSHSKKK